MKKLLAVLLALVLALGMMSFANADAMDPEALSELLCGDDSLVDLIEEAQAEGELVVYGCAEEAYVAAATNHFEEITGIKTSYQRLSTTQVQGKIIEENVTGTLNFNTVFADTFSSACSVSRGAGTR